jgi:DNA repair exonuclease SbcCD nuclease subunit
MWATCPVDGCTYEGEVASVAGHVSGKRDALHDWRRLGYSGANGYKQEMYGGGHPSEPSRLVHVGDTHVGKKEGGYGRQHWPLDCRDGFRRAVSAALDVEATAVVHTGDLFHNDRNGITASQTTFVERQLRRLDSAGIPFYYILGDHERAQGRRRFERFERDQLAKHLELAPTPIGEHIALYGTDHRPEEWWQSSNWSPRPHSGNRIAMLALHQSITPLSNADYTECDARGVIRWTRSNVGFEFDVLALGHLHRDTDLRLDGCRIICGGATERLGGTEDAFDPFVGVYEATGPTDLSYHRRTL